MSDGTTILTRMETLLTAAGITGGNVKASRHAPTREKDLPATLVFQRLVRARADGGENQGVPHFRNEFTATVLLRLKGESGGAVEDAVRAETAAVETALLTNPAMLADPIEGVAGYDVETGVPDGAEGYIVDVGISFTFVTRSVFEPTFTDDLEAVALRGATGDQKFGVDLIDPGDGPDGDIELEAQFDIETEGD